MNIYTIVETVTHRITADTPNDAIREFLKDPNRYTLSVDERTVWESGNSDHPGRGYGRYVGFEEYQDAENNA